VIIARQEYTVASGKADEALAWLREVLSWESFRLIYPHGCHVRATAIGRVQKVVLEASYESLGEYLACLRCARGRPEYQAWHSRRRDYCLDVYGCYMHCTDEGPGSGNGDG